ncbi:Integrin alpha-9 [Holothuria leucospilota]|uniref:Integrin alpha-9 n=1 Tax=Holothuria leucospilota TaxID=206669 RepID=A0A9Q1BEN3_HOLLE|nr:Integrin alpha-9 [Holothuria leucospilota]
MTMDYSGIEKHSCICHVSDMHSSTTRSDFQKSSTFNIYSAFKNVKMNIMVCLIFILTLGIAEACNIDTTKPIQFQEGDGDYFGYTVLQYEDVLNAFILVGAPKADSQFQANLQSPGVIYKCAVLPPFNCDQLPLDRNENQAVGSRVDDKNNQWLGVSLATEEQKSGIISACGHRYQNDYYLGNDNFMRDDKYPIGICFSFRLQIGSSSSFETLEKRFPCLAGDDQWREPNIRWLSWCQAGVGLAYTSGGTPVYGAPGAFNWTGAAIAEMSGAFTYHDPEMPPSGTEFESDYTGYSVSTGHFVGASGEEQGVTGAPRANQLGKVTVYDISTGDVYQEIYGEPMNTYFGGAVAAVDVNNDGLSDLLVGAPLFSNDQDEGKVYVYLNTGGSENPLKLSQEIQGSRAFRARFGSSISGIKDLNHDGYFDVIIGAPYEDDGTGAVYIYLGGAEGLDPNYSQRISGADLDPALETFGISVHGGIDMDKNKYIDIVVGAYESDAVVVFKSKPIIDLQAWLELDPQSLDPEIKECTLNGKAVGCLDVTVCFKFTGLSVTSLLDIEYSLRVDEEKIAEGIDSRFVLTEQGLTEYNDTLGIPENEKRCDEPIKAYLQDNARDFLTRVPLKLIYDVFKYPVETEKRGDEPFLFEGGLPPVSNSYNCGAQTVTEEVIFVQNCGADGICQTDIKLKPTVELPGGKIDELILGASNNLFINTRIENDGEEAHQAVLRIYHPSDMGYEGVELMEVTCLTSEDCTPEVVATCSPQLAQDSSALVECSLGNPMNAHNSALLRLRFDVSDIPWSIGRKINITMVVSTVSIETESQKENNMRQLEYSLIVEADLGMVGISQPESIYYGYNATSLGHSDQKAADAAKLVASLDAADLAFDNKPYNETWIGPAFNQEFQVVNYGPGRLPVSSNVTIQVPWRTLDGDWLVFIKDIIIDGNKGSCNKVPILLLQNRRLIEVYREGSSGSIEYAEEENSEQISATSSDPRDLGCSKAKCVDVTCNIALLESDATVKITVEALLWEHTFVTRQYGFVQVVSEAIVRSNDEQGIHNQPLDDRPDKYKVITIAYTGTMGQQAIPWWVILLAILIGLLFLIAVVLILYKLKFFIRSHRIYINETLKQKKVGQEPSTAEEASEKNCTKISD